MVDLDILKVLGGIAGIGGIALGVLLIIYKEVIKKRIFPTLTQKQAFRLLVLVLVFVWSLAVLGIGAWVIPKIIGDHPPEPPALESEVKHALNLGISYYIQGDYDRATVQLNNALGISAGEDNTAIMGYRALAYYYLGRIDYNSYDPAKPDPTCYKNALSLFDNAKDIFNTVGDKGSEAQCLVWLGNTSRSLGKPDEAIVYYNSAASLSSQVNNEVYLRKGIAEAYRNLGMCYSDDKKDSINALKFLRLSYELYKDIDPIIAVGIKGTIDAIEAGQQR